MVITDGMKVTLGDTAALTFYVTPGHTAGTMSTLIPVKDRGTPHLVAEWGGTLYNFPTTVDTFERYGPPSDSATSSSGQMRTRPFRTTGFMTTRR
jgi:metallo-beta-lactamase class B